MHPSQSDNFLAFQITQSKAKRLLYGIDLCFAVVYYEAAWHPVVLLATKSFKDSSQPGSNE